jgi:Protein of unknown function (DUF4232)
MTSVRAVGIIAVVAMFAACSTTTPTEGPNRTNVASQPVAPPSATPPIQVATPSPTPTPQVVLIDLTISQTPAFTGDKLAFTVVSELSPTTTSVPLSGATIDFGERTRATATGACDPTILIEHSYRRAGLFLATLASATRCGPTTANALSASGISIQVLPAAPASSARWPSCSTWQLRLASPWSGAAAGNVGTQITIENVGSRGCVLEGYPDLRLIGRDGRVLPTQTTPATTGAYLFPAVVPHRVALEPGGFANFMIGSSDTPFGPNADAPYDVACPPGKALRVNYPGTRQFGTAVVQLAPCNGVMTASPILPGASRIEFT